MQISMNRTRVNRPAMRMWEWFDMWALYEEVSKFPLYLSEGHDNDDDVNAQDAHYRKHLAQILTDHNSMTPEESQARLRHVGNWTAAMNKRGRSLPDRRPKKGPKLVKSGGDKSRAELKKYDWETDEGYKKRKDEETKKERRARQSGETDAAFKKRKSDADAAHERSTASHAAGLRGDGHDARSAHSMREIMAGLQKHHASNRHREGDSQEGTDKSYSTPLTHLSRVASRVVGDRNDPDRMDSGPPRTDPGEGKAADREHDIAGVYATTMTRHGSSQGPDENEDTRAIHKALDAKDEHLDTEHAKRQKASDDAHAQSKAGKAGKEAPTVKRRTDIHPNKPHGYNWIATKLGSGVTERDIKQVAARRLGGTHLSPAREVARTLLSGGEKITHELYARHLATLLKSRRAALEKSGTHADKHRKATEAGAKTFKNSDGSVSVDALNATSSEVGKADERRKGDKAPASRRRLHHPESAKGTNLGDVDTHEKLVSRINDIDKSKYMDENNLEHNHKVKRKENESEAAYQARVHADFTKQHGEDHGEKLGKKLIDHKDGAIDVEHAAKKLYKHGMRQGASRDERRHADPDHLGRALQAHPDDVHRMLQGFGTNPVANKAFGKGAGPKEDSVQVQSAMRQETDKRSAQVDSPSDAVKQDLHRLYPKREKAEEGETEEEKKKKESSFRKRVDEMNAKHPHARLAEKHEAPKKPAKGETPEAFEKRKKDFADTLDTGARGTRRHASPGKSTAGFTAGKAPVHPGEYDSSTIYHAKPSRKPKQGKKSDEQHATAVERFTKAKAAHAALKGLQISNPTEFDRQNRALHKAKLSAHYDHYHNAHSGVHKAMDEVLKRVTNRNHTLTKEYYESKRDEARERGLGQKKAAEAETKKITHSELIAHHLNHASDPESKKHYLGHHLGASDKAGAAAAFGNIKDRLEQHGSKSMSVSLTQGVPERRASGKTSSGGDMRDDEERRPKHPGDFVKPAKGKRTKAAHAIAISNARAKHDKKLKAHADYETEFGQATGSTGDPRGDSKKRENAERKGERSQQSPMSSTAKRLQARLDQAPDAVKVTRGATAGNKLAAAERNRVAKVKVAEREAKKDATKKMSASRAEKEAAYEKKVKADTEPKRSAEKSAKGTMKWDDKLGKPVPVAAEDKPRAQIILTPTKDKEGNDLSRRPVVAPVKPAPGTPGGRMPRGTTDPSKLVRLRPTAKGTGSSVIRHKDPEGSPTSADTSDPKPTSTLAQRAAGGRSAPKVDMHVSRTTPAEKQAGEMFKSGMTKKPVAPKPKPKPVRTLQGPLPPGAGVKAIRRMKAEKDQKSQPQPTSPSSPYGGGGTGFPSRRTGKKPAEEAPKRSFASRVGATKIPSMKLPGRSGEVGRVRREGDYSGKRREFETGGGSPERTKLRAAGAAMRPREKKEESFLVRSRLVLSGSY